MEDRERWGGLWSEGVSLGGFVIGISIIMYISSYNSVTEIC